MRDDATAPEKSKRAKTGSAPMPDFGSWMDSGNHALEGWVQSNSSMMKSSFELAQDMLSFSQARLHANIDAWNALTACRSPDDLAACQKSFAEQATAQYLDEASRLATRMMSLMSGAAVLFREQTKKF